MSSEDPMTKYYAVRAPDGEFVRSSLATSEDDAIDAVESDEGGLDTPWDELFGEGYEVVEVQLEVVNAHYAVKALDGSLVEGSLARSRERAVHAAESFYGGLPGYWDELQEEGFEVVEVRVKEGKPYRLEVVP